MALVLAIIAGVYAHYLNLCTAFTCSWGGVRGGRLLWCYIKKVQVPWLRVCPANVGYTMYLQLYSIVMHAHLESFESKPVEDFWAERGLDVHSSVGITFKLRELPLAMLISISRFCCILPECALEI